MHLACSPQMLPPPTMPALNRRRGSGDYEAVVAGRAFPAWRAHVRRAAVGLPWLMPVCAACVPGRAAREAGDSSCPAAVRAARCRRVGAGHAEPWDTVVVGDKPSLAGILRADGCRFAAPN